MKAHFEFKAVYGRKLYWAKNPLAEAIVKIKGLKALTQNDIQLLVNAGLEIYVIPTKAPKVPKVERSPKSHDKVLSDYQIERLNAAVDDEPLDQQPCLDPNMSLEEAAKIAKTHLRNMREYEQSEVDEESQAAKERASNAPKEEL